MGTTTHIEGSVHCADFIGRDQVNHYGYSAEDVAALIEKVLSFLDAGAAFIPQRSAGGLGQSLQAEVNGEKLIFHPGAVQRLSRGRDLHSYLLALTVHRDYQVWATKFVPLAGRVDVRKVIEGLEMPVAFSEFRLPGASDGPGAQPTTIPLDDITEALEKHAAFIILGDPGSGKTTTLQKIAFETARGLLSRPEGDQVGQVPLFVRLSQQGAHDPFGFLAEEWERRTGLDFGDALADGQVLILADGVNEIQREERNARLKAWRLFAEEYAGGNKIAFTGRERDYDQQLNLPRVLVESLDDDRITDYLRRHDAEGLQELLADSQTRLHEMAGNPFNLALLTFAYKSNQGGMANRGALLHWFANELLKREKLLAHPGWLPREVQITALARLAYAMQARGESTTFLLDKAKSALPGVVSFNGEEVPLDTAALFRFGRAATILDPGTLPDVRFNHHLLQEYFASLELLLHFKDGKDLAHLWKVPRLESEMPPGKVGEWDPLPEPPPTGWEVTTVLACGLAPVYQVEPASLVEAVRLHNPILAGRCLDEAGVPLPEEPLGKVRDDLLSELYNPIVHLRARLQAGYTLGRVGDPRFQPETLNGMQVIPPKMVPVPGGTYWIGSEGEDPNAYEDEKPRHPVEIAPFSIGRWPVTNAEFACFLEAGGYEERAWWEGELAERWLEGEDVSGGGVSGWLEWWRFTQNTPDWKAHLEGIGGYTPDFIETLEEISGMSEAELRVDLSRSLAAKSRKRPDRWRNPQFNNPSQPAVGVTWFEARAYCAWLSAVTGDTYRLPAEVEWEAAARGETGRVYAWGDDWSAERANTVEGRVLRPSPVGFYTAAGGANLSGIEDLTGNVWEWTSSLYLPYPYNPDQAERLDSEAERVARGGSWLSSQRLVRCACRFRGPPAFYLITDIGFRVVSPSR